MASDNTTGSCAVGPEDLNALCRAKPFVPFRLHVTGGTTYDITNPEFISIGRRVAFVGVRRDPNSEYFDEPVIVALVHMTQVEPIITPAAAG